MAANREVKGYECADGHTQLHAVPPKYQQTYAFEAPLIVKPGDPTSRLV